MLNIKNLEVAYETGKRRVEALKSLNLQISGKEYVAVLGPNGSGKSTLIKAICGLVHFDIGQIEFSGSEVRSGRFGEDMFGRIAVVFQEPRGQFLMPTVEREIGTVLQNLGLSYRQQEEIFRQVVDILSLRALLTENPRSLSGGQMQLANLACALAVNPEMILLDEPTTFLDAQYRNMLLEYIDSLHRSGLTVMHVTQYPDEALRADRAVIVDSGEIVADGKPGDLLLDEELLAQHSLMMPRELAGKKWLGFDFNSLKPHGLDEARVIEDGRLQQVNQSRKRDAPFLLLKNMTFSYRDGPFSIKIEELGLHRDELVGLVGATGSGKSTLAFLLAGLLKPDSGEALMDGTAISKMQVNLIRRRVGITWQMPDPAFIGPTVADEINMAASNLLKGSVDIDRILLKAGLSGFNDRIVDTLSGGEKRKLSLACALTGNPDYLILDEPSAFLDPAAQLDMQQIIRQLSSSGNGALIIGHDIPFMSELADRVIGLREGLIVFDLPAAEFFSEPAWLQILRLPHEPLILFRKRLAEKGIRIPFGSLDPKRLANYLEQSGIRWQEFA